MSPAAVVTGAARGIGAATVDALVGAGWQVVALDRCADDPALDYHLASASDLDAVQARHGDAVHAMVGDVRSPGDMQAAVDAVGPPLRRLAGGSRGSRGHRRRSSAVGDRRRALGRDVRRQRDRCATPGGCGRPGADGSRRAAPGPGGGGGFGGGIARFATAQRVQRVEARGDRADSLSRSRSGRDRGDRERRVSGIDAGPLLDVSAAVDGLPTAEAFAGQQLVERLLEPEESAAMIAWLCGPSSSGVTGAASAVDGGMTS